MRKLDLHGFTLEDAYQEFTDFIYEAYQGSIPKVEVITGKSGKIRKNFLIGQKAVTKYSTLNRVGMKAVLLSKSRGNIEIKLCHFGKLIRV